MSTLDEQYRLIINLAMGILKRDMQKYVEEGQTPEEVFKTLALRVLVNKEDLFFMASWEVDDNLRIQTVIAVMYAHYMKADEKVADALKAELEVMRMLGSASQNGTVLDVDSMVYKAEGHEFLGMSGLYSDVKKQWEFETVRKPVIERGERELEGKE